MNVARLHLLVMLTAACAGAPPTILAQQPRIMDFRREGQEAIITWSGNPSHLHIVEFAETPDSAEWSGLKVVHAPSASNTARLTIPDTIGSASSGFFRVRTGPPPDKPNMIVIVTDDGGWADVGYHTAPGQVPVQTPHIDRLKYEGIRLERFYATPVCSVTRACLLTGRNSLRTGVSNTRGLDLREHTLPETFRAAGYQTAMCGKWHLGGPYNNHRLASIGGMHCPAGQESELHEPIRRGWQIHYGQYTGAIDYFSHVSKEDGRPDWWLNGRPVVETVDEQGHGGYSTDLLADKAVSFIRGRDPLKPLLLYLAFNGIHGAIQAPQSAVAKYASLGVNAANRRLVAAAMDLVDAGIGRVLGALDDEGLRENTLVMWFSDNGGDLQKGSINLPLRGTKGDGYDAAIRTTASIRWPGRLPSDVVSNQFVWVGDLFPTLCAAAGVTPAGTKPFDGTNLWPALLAAGNDVRYSRGRPLVTGHSSISAFNEFPNPAGGGARMFKLVRSRSGQLTANELFNIDDDPLETVELSLNNTVPAYAPILGALGAAIDDVTGSAELYPPFIATQPQGRTIDAGESVTLYASFSSYGRSAPSVVWRKNGAALVQGGGVAISSTAPALEPPGVVALESCTTTAGVATVLCASTRDLVVGLGLSGANTPSKATVTSIVGPTQFTMSHAASVTASGLSWSASAPVSGLWVSSCTITGATPTAAGSYDLVVDNTGNRTIRLQGCTVSAGSPWVTCPTTAGLEAGMNISGAGIAIHSTVAVVQSPNRFMLSHSATTDVSNVVLFAGSGGTALSAPAVLVVR